MTSKRSALSQSRSLVAGVFRGVIPANPIDIFPSTTSFLAQRHHERKLHSYLSNLTSNKSLKLYVDANLSRYTDIMGKVHGSLARAGKVKSQTPKVEKQEKKKSPKGRAKKRILYTRRFVNVTLTGGKRKMNPNPGS
ncbi:hypothetical protein TWF281_007701 [Arthrobotrys megalospora]